MGFYLILDSLFRSSFSAGSIRCRDFQKSAHRSPFLFNLAGKVLIVNFSGLNPLRSSDGLSGAATVAKGLGRAV